MPFIHPSAWNMNSMKFALTGFAEVSYTLAISSNGKEVPFAACVCSGSASILKLL
jgi:hypothetical protein